MRLIDEFETVLGAGQNADHFGRLPIEIEEILAFVLHRRFGFFDRLSGQDFFRDVRAMNEDASRLVDVVAVGLINKIYEPLFNCLGRPAPE